jgi:hypothetical protein
VAFTTEGIENIPAGYKAKETYWLINENEFTETFEIAEPGKITLSIQKINSSRRNR